MRALTLLWHADDGVRSLLDTWGPAGMGLLDEILTLDGQSPSEDVQRLRRRVYEDEHSGLVALVHVAHARAYADVIPLATRMAVLWNLAIPASRDLEALGHLLDEEDALLPGLFQGFLPYHDTTMPASTTLVEQVRETTRDFEHLVEPAWSP